MSTTKTKKEAKLKARKTSLSKKTQEELIDIILKKDNTERKNNDKIMNLTKKVDDLNVIIEANAANMAELENELNSSEANVIELKAAIKLKDAEKKNLKDDNCTLEKACEALRKELKHFDKDIMRIKTIKIVGLCSIILNVVLLLILML